MNYEVSQYVKNFVKEIKNSLESMNLILLKIDKNPSNTKFLKELIEVTFIIQAMSATMGFQYILNLTYEMGNTLGLVLEKGIEAPDQLVDLLFRVYYRLDSSINYIANFSVEEERNHLDLINKLIKVFDIKEEATIVEGQTKETIEYKPVDIITENPSTESSVLLFKLDEDIYGIKIDYVTEVISVNKEKIKSYQDQEAIIHNDNTLPIVDLSKLLEIDNKDEKEEVNLIICIRDDLKLALKVDKLLKREDLLINSLGKSLKDIKYFSGTAILNDENIVLILDLKALL